MVLETRIELNEVYKIKGKIMSREQKEKLAKVFSKGAVKATKSKAEHLNCTKQGCGSSWT